jgi:uncharacterized protein
MSATRASADGVVWRLGEILKRSSWLMRALRAARTVGAPDWFIAAGAIRDTVWDDLHNRDLTDIPRDIDLAFFDPLDLGEARERTIETQLRTRAPDLPWDVKNQAAVHLWYPKLFGMDVQPFTCNEEAIATFPEIATCVGVRLLDDDDLLVAGPHGLDDLLDGVCRHNPTRVSAAFYRDRLATKDWSTRWPRIRYVN